MSTSQARVVGSGFTRFEWRGQTIAWARTIQDTAPTPVARTVPIQGITDRHPREHATPRAVTGGTLVLQLWELKGKKAWHTLSGLSSSNNILEILENQINLGAVTMRKIIENDDGSRSTTEYYNCVVTDVDESENVSIEAMDVQRRITVVYTHTKTY